MIPEFLQHLKAAGRAQSTIQTYLLDLKHPSFSLQNTPLESTSATLLENIVAGHSDSRQDNAVLGPTLNRMKGLYKFFFGWCQKTGRITHKPAAALCLARVTSKKTLPMSFHEIKLLLSTVRELNNRLAGRDEARAVWEVNFASS